MLWPQGCGGRRHGKKAGHQYDSYHHVDPGPAPERTLVVRGQVFVSARYPARVHEGLLRWGVNGPQNMRQARAEL